MAASQPLKDTELVDCATANAKQGVETAAHLCGYGQDLAGFQAELKKACDRMGVHFEAITDLITPQRSIIQDGLEIAPDSDTQL
ncbi:hypothetical protein [Merismopedia glauca]|uniref:Uncharacterized protein n=1 Tax=Merismopedia glauca CCAP 1448/3 TaxID=1296344 RepID=A0A2T1C4X1_9CYAN|nr:hypothetical protein [Merismopedia glauca]PSB03309.1 hypothetical protein C7B64_09030 [Merismopedia glauca CCAP 1448/3]